MNEKELMSSIEKVLIETYDDLSLVQSDMDEMKVLLAYRMATILGQCHSKDDVSDIVVDWKDSTDEEFIMHVCDIVDSMKVDDKLDNCKDSLLAAFCYIKKMQQAQNIEDCNHNGNMMLPMSIKCLTSPKDDMLDALEVSGDLPSDRVYISQDAVEELKTLWLKDDISDYARYVPSDIIFAKKLSILDMEIVIDENPKSLIQPMRVVISENYQDLLDKYADDDKVITIGCLIVPIGGSDKNGFVFSIGVLPGFDCICIDMEPAMYGLQQNLHNAFFDKFRPHEGGMLRVCTILMQYWYSIQLSMLHPVTKMLYEHKHKIKDRRKYMLGKKCDKLVRPINTVHITLDEIRDVYKSANYNNHANYYVIGHWRTYKTGKKTFVSPYWKGEIANSQELK